MIYQKKKGGFIVAGYGFYDAHRIHQKTQSEPADTRERLAVSSCHMQIIETILFLIFLHHSDSRIMVIVARKGDLRITGPWKKSAYFPGKPDK